MTLAFRALDKDGSGTVETSEFKHLMTHVGEWRGHFIILELKERENMFDSRRKLIEGSKKLESTRGRGSKQNPYSNFRTNFKLKM